MTRTNLLMAVFFLLFCGTASSFGQQAVSEEAKRHFDRGMAAIEMAKSPDDYAPAIKEFERAASLAPDWPDAYYNLGRVQEKAEKYRDAITSLKQYLRLAPDAGDAEAVKTLINKLEYKAETVLTVADVIDVLVSLSNKEQWQVTGDCINQPFAFIRRKGSDSVEFPFLNGLNWGPDMRGLYPAEIEGTLARMKTNTMCGAPNQAAYCHFTCLNEIEVVSRTHVKIRQLVSDTEGSPMTPPVRNGTYSCEYRKK